MYDISQMEQVTGEIEMSRRLKLLNWSHTEQFTNHNSYYKGRGENRKCIGHTLFHPDRGPGVHTHYVLVPAEIVDSIIEQQSDYFDRYIAGDR